MKVYIKPLIESIKVVPVTGLLYDSNNLGGNDLQGDAGDGAPARKLYL